jgi:hypothetical protein
MKDDHLELTDRERRAIEALGRELDREFGGAFGDPIAASELSLGSPAGAVRPKPKIGLHVALAVGAGTLSAAVIVALTTLIAARGPAPLGDGSPSTKTAPSSARAAAPVLARSTAAGKPTVGERRGKPETTAFLTAPARRSEAERGRRENARSAGRPVAPGPLMVSVALRSSPPLFQGP